MEIFTEILRFFSSIAWPAAAFGVVILFKNDIKASFPRITEAGIGGLKLQGQQTVRAASSFATTGALKKFPEHFKRTAMMERVERNLHETLTLYREEEHVDLLVRELAVSRLRTACEAIWGNVFQSQIDAMVFIEHTGGKTTKSEMERFYVASRYPEDFTFDVWLRYLVNNDLVEVADDSVTVTDLGRDFIEWLPNKAGQVRAP